MEAYIFYSFFNTAIYAFPAHWIWSDNSFFTQMGANDLAGCVPVHLVEGKASLVATFMTKLRRSFKKESKDMCDQDMALPTNVILGTFML